ncbi:DegT/DnrJ/EryC1/StrS family aminotransferase [Mycobacteroides abscessus]|uniref:DegT/DnrJ/EryC1/StrS family aminotransferase n=1 Tax=Mycobacteroides abscessus TaxID=36809 RepID=UPI000C2670E4|nr:DegT/DnrJ/EryC1/StrS family aminotransferase [Mycobacteroides abscessus]
MKIRHDELAINGGPPVRAGKDWPTWPDYDKNTEECLIAALRSSRWSVSWHSTGRKSLERIFSEKFAHYNDAKYCVSVDHGSSALVVALECLDIGPGDEVIVPVLTWVAPITAVLRVGAVPVLVDVDPASGCITAEEISAALTSRTKAVIVVHLACTVANLDDIRRVVNGVDVPIIEDCSQAHGARWNTKRVGTVGDLGVFSLGAAKTLAGGEGGAVITDSSKQYSQLQMLRADSRRYGYVDPEPGCPELVEDGAMMGANYCMPEFVAAVLLDQLGRLDEQNEKRQTRALQLERALAGSQFNAIPVPAQVSSRAIYEFGVQIEAEVLGGKSVHDFADAVSAELRTKVYPPRVPLNRSVLVRPTTKNRYRDLWSTVIERGGLRESYKGAESYVRQTILFHHSILLGDAQDTDEIAVALTKVAHFFSNEYSGM